MHVSRKRYRPLDSAEERAVHVNQRIQLLPLTDEQSYCFSWPEAPLTQWLRENTTYASLYQLFAGPSGGPVWGSGTSASEGPGVNAGVEAHMRNSAASTASNSASSFSATATGTAAKITTTAAAAAAAALSSSSRHQVDLPPVFMLDDIVVDTPSHPWSTATSSLPTQKILCGGDDVQQLLHRLRRDMDSVQAESTSAIGASGEGTSATSSPPSTITRGVRVDGEVHRASATPSASIVMTADAARAVPHPLAPPRPQSITEDSIFTFSEAQLADLIESGVLTLCAEERKGEQPGQQQQQQQSSQARSALHADCAVAGGSAMELSPSPLSPSPVTVVVIEEPPVGDAGDSAVAHASSNRDGSRCAEPRRPLQLGRQQQQQQHQPDPPHRRFPESIRRLVEQEIVGLEWRTWTQSQRTAAALQRLLSLEAALPFEPTGDDNTDAWRAVVYRLWLRWRQQPPRGASTATSEPSSSASSPLVSVQSHRPPWGAPLLPGAYLSGTSNDYFISLPSAAAAPSLSTSSASGVGGVASAWPAMSRRRGVYSFLRWKVELSAAQMAQAVDGAAEEEEHGEEEEGERHDKGLAGLDGESDESDGEEGGSARPARKNTYAKGPLVQSDTFASGRRRRRGVSDPTSTTSLSSSASSVRRTVKASRTASPPSLPHPSLNTAMSATHIKALIQTTVLTQPLTELNMDDEPSAVMERLACPDLRHDTDAWRVWLAKV